MAYDILIKSGTILDGTGKPSFQGDVAIKNDEIAAMGNLGDAGATLRIEAQGRCVAPGFIDITNHSDTHLTLFQYPNLESLLMQGVTTVIGGNCGASLAPLASREAINAIRKWADPSEINVNWENVEDYLEEIKRLRPAVNYGTFVGYGTIRRGVIGKEARVLVPHEVESMKLLLAEGMAHGAFGLSFGLSYGHERVSPTEEIVAIAKILKGRGVLKMHLRSEGRELIASINEVVQIARETQTQMQISHLKASGRNAWPSFQHALDLIHNVRESGVDINFDISPYCATGSPLYLLVPGWARQGGFAELFARIVDPEERKKIVAQIDAANIPFDRITILSAKLDTVVGKTIQEIADHSNLPPAEAVLDVIRANDGKVATIGRTISQKNIDRGVTDEESIIASDGAGVAQDMARSGNLVHPRSFGTFPHFWHRYVTDLKTLTAEVAVTKMTSLPATKLKISRRGTLQKGNFADVTVFEPQIFRDRATYRNPFRYPAGIEWVIVNGKVAVEEGRALGVRAGKVLRKE